MTESTKRPVMKAEEVAEYLGIGTAAVYSAARQNQLPSFRAGRYLLFPRALIEAKAVDVAPKDDAQ